MDPTALVSSNKIGLPRTRIRAPVTRTPAPTRRLYHDVANLLTEPGWPARPSGQRVGGPTSAASANARLPAPERTGNFDLGGTGSDLTDGLLYSKLVHSVRLRASLVRCLFDCILVAGYVPRLVL